MLPSLAVFSLFSTATIALEERLPLAMVVLSGDSELESVFRVSDVVEAVTSGLTKHTSLSVIPEVKTIVDPQISACPEDHRLTCFLDATASGPLEPRYLLVVSFLHEPEGGARISTLLIDVAAANRVKKAADRAQADWEKRIEDELSQRAAASSDILTAGSAALGAYFETLISVRFRSDFEANQHFEPFGTIALEAPYAGLEIVLDDAPIGTTIEGTTTLTNVLPGRRKLALVDPSDREERMETTLIVHSNEQAVFNARAIREDVESGPMSRDLTFWTGIGLVAAGSVFTVWGLATDPRDGHRFATLCDATEHDPSCAERGGPMAAPLGYSLAITGGVWALGTELTNDDDAPWVPFVIGLAAGALAYGVSSALDGKATDTVK